MENFIDTFKTEAKVVEKGWGREIILADNEYYTGKILEFNKDGKISMHYHVKKHETWYVQKGTFRFRTIDPISADIHTYNGKAGDIFEIAPGDMHQLEAYEDVIIFEVSTPDDVNDSYRVLAGDSQKN